jgi:hypothetical protein
MGTQIAVKPIVLRDVRVRIDADNFEDAVSSVTFTPNSTVVTWQGGTPKSTHSDTTTPTWTATIEFAQDWENPKSLSRYLYANGGTKKDMEFAPQGGLAKATFNSTISIADGAIGGAIGAFATSSVTMGATRPVIGTAVAADEPTAPAA